jgi:hypothetical protein
MRERRNHTRREGSDSRPSALHQKDAAGSRPRSRKKAGNPPQAATDSPGDSDASPASGPGSLRPRRVAWRCRIQHRVGRACRRQPD